MRLFLVFITGTLAAFATPTTTIVGSAPGSTTAVQSGIGLLLAFDACSATNGCTTNSTGAQIQIKDDSSPAVSMVAKSCGDLVSSHSASLRISDLTVASFFMAFTMTEGDVGTIRINKGCVEDGSSALWPTADLDYTSIQSFLTGSNFDGASQYTNQPYFPSKLAALRTNDVDVYIPYLLMATPSSPNTAFSVTNFRRSKQFTYVDKTAAISLFFSEKMATGTGRAYLLEYAPTGTTTLGTAVKEHTLTLAVDASTASYGTKVTASLPHTVVANRLYSLIVEPGALTDVAGNAFGGINGYGDSSSTCVDVSTNPIGRDCVIQFVVPYKQADVAKYPSGAAFEALADGAGKNISAGTNIMLTFPDPVYVGTLSTSASQITFSDETARISGDEFLTLLHTGAATHTDYYHAIDSSKVYLIEPRQTLKATAITKVATTVNVTVPTGTFDYVDVLKFSFPSNPTEFGIKKPEVKYFELYGQLKQNPQYYASSGEGETAVAGGPLVSFVAAHAAPIVLYFDTRVTAQAYKKIVLTPDSYESKTWKNVTTATDCYDANVASGSSATHIAQLAPCSFAVTLSTSVTLTQKTKVTINPRQLIPGEVYTITVPEGAFATDATPSGATFGNAEWSTKFVVNQQLKECLIGVDATSPARPVHRTTSIRLAFDGPLKVAADGKISVSGFPQLFSDPDAVYYRNNDAAVAPSTVSSNVIRYMMIITPRQGNGITGLQQGNAQTVTIEAGAITNFPANSALCSSFTTQLEDNTPPRVVSVTNVAGALSEATPLSAGSYQLYSAANSETAFTITFSEKVSFNGAPSQKPYISLTQGTTAHRFCASSTTQYGNERICPANSATSSEGGSVWKITVGDVQLAAGTWTLNIPQGVLKDNAHETGGVQNALDKDYTFQVTVDADVTKPTCTIETNELILEADGKLVEPDSAHEQTTGTFRHTVVVKFSEAVQIAKPTAAIALVGRNRTNTALVPAQLRLRLDGKNQTSSTSQGAIQFNWLANAANTPGGNQIMFLFAKFTPQYNFSHYYFELEDNSAITDLKGNPMSDTTASDQNALTAVLGNCLKGYTGPTNMQVHDPDVHPSDRPTFTVYESAATASCTSASTNGWAGCTASNTSQFLLEFSERVRVNTGTPVVATLFSQNVTGGPFVPGDWSSVAGAQRESIELKSGTSAGDLIMSYDGKRAYLEVPYVHLRGKSFEFLQLNVTADAFEDMERRQTTGNTTLLKRLYYNGTITNMTSPTGPNVRKERKVEDAVGPVVMMQLPGGVQSGKQQLHNISLNANITLKMSEDVYIATTASAMVRLVECGTYMTSTLQGATGNGGFYPLTNPACTSTTALAVTVDFEMDSTSTTKRKNTTVVINPTAALKPWTKYQMTIDAGAFTDTSITPVSSSAISSGTSKYQLEPFFTRGDTAAPTVTTWQVISTPVPGKRLSTNVDVATLWFDQPIAGYSSAVSNVLVSRRASGNHTATIHCFDGGFSCTITATTDLLLDTTYTIHFPVNIMDLYNSAYTGKLPLVGERYTFKTQAADESDGPPKPLFCIVEDPAPYDKSTTTDSWSHAFQKVPSNFKLLLGFTEAVRFAGGYSAKKYALSTSTSEPKICATSSPNDGCVDEVQITMIEGNTVMSVTPTTAPTVSQLWDFFLPASLITDLAGNAMATSINGSFCRFETVAPGALSAPTTLPEDNDEKVHKNDFITLKFSETVTSNNATAELFLQECSGTTASTNGACTSPSTVASIAASQLKFGNRNAMWQQDYTMKQGRRYQLVIEPTSFNSATGATWPSALTTQSSWTVALQNDDFRGTNLTAGQLNRTKYGLLSKWGAACVGTSATDCSTQITADGAPSAATTDSIFIFFPSKFTGLATNLKVYLNKTSGPSAATSLQVTNPTIASTKDSLQIPLTSAQEGVTYELHIYDEAWGVDILEDADTYYWNSGSSTGLKASAVGGKTTFGVRIPKTYTYYEQPSFDIATNLAAPVNATVDVPVTSMVTLFVKSNLTDLALDSASITLTPYARKAGSSGELYGTLGQTQCATGSKFTDCCGASSGSALTVTRTYADRVGNISSTTTGDDYVPVYFRPANGLEKYTCYQVDVAANMFDAGGKKNAAYGGYDMWFATADIAAGDVVPPDAATDAFATSSKGSAGVSRSAWLSVTFSEPVAVMTKSLIGLTNAAGNTVDFDASVSGSTITLKPLSTASQAYEWADGDTHTLTVNPGAVADAAGNLLSTTLSYTFTTEYKDSVAPKFLHSLPEVGDDASVNARMVQFMSEAVTPVSGQVVTTTGPAISVSATQSSWKYGATNTAANAYGLVLFDGSRITTLSYGPLTADASTTSLHLTTPIAAVEDFAGNSAAASGTENKVTFQAKARADFAETTRAAGTFGGDVDAALTGAAGVDVCGTTISLGGGMSGESGSDRVCTATVSTSGEVAWECVSAGGGARWNRVSAAVDMDCNVWLVGGDGSDTALTMSADTGATFEAVTALPLPVCDGSGCTSSDALPTSFPGAAVGVLNGWQVVVCGGGLDRCWVAVSKYGGSDTGFARGTVVDTAIKERYYGTLLDMGAELYFAGGQDNADNSAVTRCYQDVWSGDGYSFQVLTVKHTKENRCSGSYVRTGDGTLYVLGGTNTTDSIRGEGYQVGWESSVYELHMPSSSTRASITSEEYTYDTTYRKPFIAAVAPSGTVALSTTTKTVTVVMSEKVYGAQMSSGATPVCVTILRNTNAARTTTPTGGVPTPDAAATIYCSADAAFDGKCYLTSCATDPLGIPKGTLVSDVTTSLSGNTLEIRLGNWVIAADVLTVTFADGFVYDAAGNPADVGTWTSGRPGSAASVAVPSANGVLAITYAAAPAAFAKDSQYPATSDTTTTNPNFVFAFNEVVSANSGLTLTVSPRTATAWGVKYVMNSTHTERCVSTACAFISGAATISTAGKLLKIAMPAGEFLTMGISYTYTLAASSVTGAVGGAYTAAISLVGGFTTVNALLAGQSGTVYTAGTVQDSETDLVAGSNDTAGDPKCSVDSTMSPPHGTTDVDPAEVHVVVTCSEPVYINRTKTETFSLKWFNASKPAGSEWTLVADLNKDTSIFFDGPNKQMTFRLEGLEKGRKYSITAAAAEVVRDYRAATDQMGNAYTWSAILDANYFFYTSTDVVPTADIITPKVAAGDLSQQLVEGNEEQTAYFFMFTAPVELNATALKFSQNGVARALTETEWGFSADEIFTVTFADRGLPTRTTCSASTSASVYKVMLQQEALADNNGWKSAHYDAALTSSTACRPGLVESTPYNPASAIATEPNTLKHFGSDSTVVLRFNEAVVAGTGSITLTGTHSGTSINFAANDTAVRILDNYVVVGGGEGLPLLPGEEYTVSVQNRTMRSKASLGYLAVPTSYTSSKFSVIPKLDFRTAMSSIDINAHGAAVLVDSSNTIYVVGGWATPTSGNTALIGALRSNKTYAMATYRDSDAFSGSSPVKTCSDPDPCISDTPVYQRADTAVYQSASTRGARAQNINGVAYSNKGNVLHETTLPTQCVCPTCIVGPDVTSVTNIVESEYATVYAQTPATHTGFTVDCNVGVGDLLKDQGYTSNEKQFQCWPAGTGWKRDYFGEWKVYAESEKEWTAVAEGTEVCAPKICPASALPTISNADGDIVCEGVEANAEMPHGQTCTWTCASGYEVKGELSCDRGVFVGGAACVKRACPTLTASEKQVLSQTTSVYQDTVSVSCATGYKLKGETGTPQSIECTVIGDTMEYSAQPAVCEKRACAPIGPLNYVDGGCTLDAEMEFGATCSIGCTNGFANADGTKAATAECTCTDAGECSVRCGSGGCDAQCSAAVECNGSDAQASNTANAGTCTGNTVATDSTCTRTCSGGYTVGGTRDGKTTVEFTCSDAAGTGTFSTSDTCVERVCDDSSLTGVSAATGTISTAAGGVTEVTCSGTDQSLVGANFVKCEQGSYIGCDDEGCAAAGAIPTCMGKGATSTVVEVVTFEMEFAMDTSWVNPATCGKAKDSIADTFCGAEYMDCAASGLVLTVTGLSVGGTDPCAAARQLGSEWQRQLVAGDALKVEFEATAKPGASVAAATAALEKATEAVAKIETMDTAEMTGLSSALSKDLTTNVGVTISVTGVVVTQSARKVEKVVVLPPKPEPAAGGLGGGAIAGIVIGILVVVGGGFFLMKKGGGASDQA